MFFLELLKLFCDSSVITFEANQDFFDKSSVYNCQNSNNAKHRINYNTLQSFLVQKILSCLFPAPPISYQINALR